MLEFSVGGMESKVLCFELEIEDVCFIGLKVFVTLVTTFFDFTNEGVALTDQVKKSLLTRYVHRK